MIDLTGVLSTLGSVLVAIGLVGGAFLGTVVALHSWQWARKAVGVGGPTLPAFTTSPYGYDFTEAAPLDRGLEDFRDTMPMYNEFDWADSRDSNDR